MNRLSRTLRYPLIAIGIAAGTVLAASRDALAKVSEAAEGESAPYVVTTPVTGYALPAGSSTDITWTDGDTSQRMGIWLIDSDEWSVVAEIATEIPNDGHESWNIPASLPPGEYQIYIENHDATMWTYGTPFTVY